MTEKNGFSVVAPMKVTQRFSTAGSRASCWALLKRWTSSTNSTVCRPVMPSSRLALLDGRADVLDAGRDRGHLDEAPLGGAGDDVGEGGLAGARAAPTGTATSAPRLDEPAQRRAGAEQVLLADHLVEAARAHPHREGLGRAGPPPPPNRTGCPQ